MQIKVTLPKLHRKQVEISHSRAKRRIVCAGRRGGKTVCAAYITVRAFLSGRRVLYATPTDDQLISWWSWVKQILSAAIESNVLYKNETKHILSAGSEMWMRGKTAWNADTLRGDFADLLILDEFQMMSEDAWELVGAPMLLDNDGDAIFIYTPPSTRASASSKAKDKLYVVKMFNRAKEDNSGRWGAFHFTSHDNPHISTTALDEITNDISNLAYRQEIMAENITEVPGALWKREHIKRVDNEMTPDQFDRIVVGLDATATSAGDATGIVVDGSIYDESYKPNLYVLEDATVSGSPGKWGKRVVDCYYRWRANSVIAESNQGGEMIEHVIHSTPGGENIRVVLVHAHRGKALRAEPISTQYEHGRGYHVGSFPELEDEMCMWLPGGPSPNRLDAMVTGATALLDSRGARGT